MSGGGHRMNMDFLAMAKKLGANEILQKPFRHRELVSLVARFTGGATPLTRTNRAPRG